MDNIFILFFFNIEKLFNFFAGIFYYIGEFFQFILLSINFNFYEFDIIFVIFVFIHEAYFFIFFKIEAALKNELIFLCFLSQFYFLLFTDKYFEIHLFDDCIDCLFLFETFLNKSKFLNSE